MLSKYMEEKVNYLMEDVSEYDSCFITLLEGHKGIGSLIDRTKAILKDAGYEENFWENEFDKCQNLQGWVFKYNDILRDIEEAKIQTESNKLKEILRNKIGDKMHITIRGTTIIGYDAVKENKFKIVKDAIGKIFLLPPRASRKGYNLDQVTILAVK